jgi:flavin-dependent dehydrogenase
MPGSAMSADPLPREVDVVVVGARAAGAATAMLLARFGLDVLAIDRGAYGADTLSTHALMRGGVLQLSRWGLLDRLRQGGTPVVRRTTFCYADAAVAVEIKAKDGVDGLYAPRRTGLDALLVDAAREAGAQVLHGTQMTALLRQPDGRVQGIELRDGAGGSRRVRASWVVGADGVRSGVARAAGARTLRQARHTSGIVYGYWRGLDLDGYQWRYVRGASTGAVPTDNGAACVFASISQRRFFTDLAPDVAGGYARVLAEVSPDLARDVASSERQEPLRGFPGQPGFLKQAWGPGWALVGDAGYFKDPITAHGITDALRDAELLARAIASGREAALAEYQAERDELSTALLDLTDAVAAYDWSLEAVQELHRELSESMKREVKAILALGAVPEARDRRTA